MASSALKLRRVVSRSLAATRDRSTTYMRRDVQCHAAPRHVMLCRAARARVRVSVREDMHARMRGMLRTFAALIMHWYLTRCTVPKEPVAPACGAFGM